MSSNCNKTKCLYENLIFHFAGQKLSIPIRYKKEDKWWIARCAENYIVTRGRSLKETKELIKEALECYIETLKDIGELRRLKRFIIP